MREDVRAEEKRQEEAAGALSADKTPGQSVGDVPQPEAQRSAGDARQPGTQRPVAGRVPQPQAVQQTVRRTKPAVPFPVFGAASAIYALFYTFCLYKNTSGITYPFFVAGILCYLFFCMKKYGVSCENSKTGKAAGAFYLVSILLLGISVCLTDDGKLLWMTKTGIFLLTVTLALRCFYRTRGWSFARYLSGVFHSLMEMLHYLDTPFSDAAEFFRDKDEKKESGKGKYVFLGVLVAVPLLVVVLALLLSADAVFMDMFQRLLGDISFADCILVCLMAVMMYVLSYSFVRGLTTYRMPEEGKARKKGEPVAAITFTLLLALVYLVFCVIQIVYLFGGLMQLPEGYTWASYARQGFFQLLFVCLINLVVVLVCLSGFGESKLLKAILTAISLMTYILMASSAYRMILYIQAYYLTFLRLFVLWALLVIAVVFAGVIISIYRKSFPLFGFCTVVVTLFYLALAFAKPDYWVAKYDVEHAQLYAGTDGQGSDSADWGEAMMEDGIRTAAGFDDRWYLSGLSADAAPILMQEKVRSAWADSSAMRSYYSRMQEKTEDMTLRSLNFSRWQAKRLLDGWYGLEQMESYDTGKYSGILWGDRIYVPIAVVNNSDRGEKIGIVDGDEKNQVYLYRDYPAEKFLISYLDSGLMDSSMLLREVGTDEVPEGVEVEYE